jgi:hypothetical protein
MDMYQNGAEDLLRELAHLKSKERNLLADIKAVKHCSRITSKTVTSTTSRPMLKAPTASRTPTSSTALVASPGSTTIATMSSLLMKTSKS